jgi:hypothetical protein
MRVTRNEKMRVMQDKEDTTRFAILANVRRNLVIKACSM